MSRLRATREEIEAALAYEELLVAALFREWGPRVAEMAGVVSGNRVLDVACGTGVLAREAVGRVGAGGAVVGVDAGRGMVAVATRLDSRVRWVEGVAEELPFRDGWFDVVVCQFGLMFFADAGRAVDEMLRVAAPGGTVAIAVWDGLDRQPAYAEEVALLDAVAGRAAGDAVRVPFGMGDRRRLEELFERPGVIDVAIETLRGTARFPSVGAMVEADLRGWLPLMGVVLDEALIADILAAAESALAKYVAGDGRMVFETSAHVVTLTRA